MCQPHTGPLSPAGMRPSSPWHRPGQATPAASCLSRLLGTTAAAVRQPARCCQCCVWVETGISRASRQLNNLGAALQPLLSKVVPPHGGTQHARPAPAPGRTSHAPPFWGHAFMGHPRVHPTWGPSTTSTQAVVHIYGKERGCLLRTGCTLLCCSWRPSLFGLGTEGRRWGAQEPRSGNAAITSAGTQTQQQQVRRKDTVHTAACTATAPWAPCPFVTRHTHQ
jgi:hypothetical protein